MAQLQRGLTPWKTQSKPFVPRSFQEVGISLGLSQACAGFLLDPGLGKTTIMYAIFSILQQMKMAKKMLVVCPLKPAYRVWPNQKNRWDEFKHLRVDILHGKDKDAILASDDYDIYVINPEGLAWLLGADSKNKPDPRKLAAVRQKFDILCVDESTKFKDTQTNRFKLFRHTVPVFKRRYILTGTPTPTGLEGLFGQIYLLDEGAALGRYITAYRAAYFHTMPWDKYNYIPNHDAAQRIGDKIAPLVLRASRNALDLPALLFDDRYVDLPAAAQRAYKDAEEDMILRLEETTIVAANAAVASAKCRQIANGFIYDENKTAHPIHDEKMVELLNLVEELDGEPLVVTYEFVEDRERLTAALKCPCISTGNAKKDEETITRFIRGAYPVVIGSTASISLGIDGLQDVCGHMAMFGVTWKLQDYLQVIDRIRRQGSTHGTVIVHRILARSTVDERVVRRLDALEGDMLDFMALLQEIREHAPVV